MIEGFYAKPSCPEDHQLNFFLTVLDHAVAHSDLTAEEALDLLYVYQAAPDNSVHQLPDVADSSVRNLNGVLRIIFDRE